MLATDGHRGGVVAGHEHAGLPLVVRTRVGLRGVPGARAFFHPRVLRAWPFWRGSVSRIFSSARSRGARQERVLVAVLVAVGVEFGSLPMYLRDVPRAGAGRL